MMLWKRHGIIRICQKNLISQFAMENSGNKNKNTKFNPGQKETVA